MIPEKLGGKEHMSRIHITTSVLQEAEKANPPKFLGICKYREKSRGNVIIDVGTNYTPGENLDSVKSDHRALGATIKGTGVQLVSSSILPVRESGARRALTIQVDK